MSFMLRALAVIGALTYLALRDEGRHTAVSLGSDALSALPGQLSEPSVRTIDRMVRTAAEGEIRHVAGSAISRDTLSITDRQPSWRGNPAR